MLQFKDVSKMLKLSAFCPHLVPVMVQNEPQRKQRHMSKITDFSSKRNYQPSEHVLPVNHGIQIGRELSHV
jgi:hypothetical protein